MTLSKGEAGLKETTRLPTSSDYHAMPPQAAESTKLLKLVTEIITE